ncbi:MAG: hypothetical protein KAJ18_01970 [Candidatus Omnitrophica bacterium]|nr:hypothetical protein [Candidatus Omnitrophota bacterium]
MENKIEGVSENQPEHKAFDFEKNSAELSISTDIYIKILSKAVGQTVGDLEFLDDALAQDDFVNAQNITHRLKGDYANMRIMSLSNSAKQMNDNIRSTPDKEIILSWLMKFKAAFKLLQEKLGAES